MMKERQEEERRARERAEQERKRAEQWAEQQRRLEEARKEAEAKAQAEHDRRIALTLESRIAAARSHMTQLRSHNSQLDSDIQVGRYAAENWWKITDYLQALSSANYGLIFVN